MDTQLLNHVWNMDCMEFMKGIANESLHLILADPPYFQMCGDFDFVFSDEPSYIQWILDCIREFHRILKPDGTLMLWGAVGRNKNTLARIAIAIEDAGLFYQQNWITQRNSRGSGTSKNYMSAREELLFLTKSSKHYTFHIPYLDEKTNRKDLGMNGKSRKHEHKRVSNVWCDISEASQSSKERFGHPTTKSIRLCERIISAHSNPAEKVYIPFAGSGSEIIACIRLGRNFIGTETNASYCSDMILPRIAAERNA